MLAVAIWLYFNCRTLNLSFMPGSLLSFVQVSSLEETIITFADFDSRILKNLVTYANICICSNLFRSSNTITGMVLL